MLKLGLPMRKKKLFYNLRTLKIKVLSTDDKKQKVPCTTPKFQVILYLGTLLSTIAWETASQIGLSNYSRVYGGASIYRSLC